MAACDTCGNDCDEAFTITQGERTGTFECAAHTMAPTCARCGCRFLGHGVEADGTRYCCASCAEHSGVAGLADRAWTTGPGRRGPVGPVRCSDGSGSGRDLLGFPKPPAGPVVRDGR